MIDRTQLGRMNDALTVYDVDQGGWENETLGLEYNLKHVALHLARDLVRKNFMDYRVVRDDLMPDAVAYALRISRWTDSGLAIPSVGAFSIDQAVYDSYSSLGLPHASWLIAAGQLSNAVHGLEHKTEEAESRLRLKGNALNAAGALMTCAQFQAREYGLDIEESLIRKLDALRIRFGIG